MTKDETAQDVRYLQRPDGAVAYTVSGEGPLIVCVPGMGDLRASYRFLAPALVGAGYRVAVMDLRGHGDSDTTFAEYGDEATAGDIAALIESLGGPAVIIGNSMAAGCGVLVGAARPELVRGLVLVGPFVRDGKVSAVQRVMLRVAMAAPWAAASWKAYLPKLYAGTKPADFAEYRASVAAAMKRPGYAKAFSQTTRTSHDPAERALPSVHTPALVVMGELDPDFPDPAAEARWIAEQLQANTVLVADAAHYPHSQRPDVVNPAIETFLHSVHSNA